MNKQRWVLLVEGDRIVGIQHENVTHWLTNPRMGSYAPVAVMPVSEHQDILEKIQKEEQDEQR